MTGFKIDIKSETQARESGDLYDYEEDDEYYEDDEYDDGFGENELEQDREVVEEYENEE